MPFSLGTLFSGNGTSKMKDNESAIVWKSLFGAVGSALSGANSSVNERNELCKTKEQTEREY